MIIIGVGWKLKMIKFESRKKSSKQKETNIRGKAFKVNIKSLKKIHLLIMTDWK